MKKYISLLFAAALTLGFTACEDVPAPYQTISTDTDKGGDSSDEATGEGSLQSPYNCIKANQIGATLASGATTDSMVYIKGIVSSIKEEYSTQYGNATFYISDNGSTNNQFYVYRAKYLGNNKYAEGQTNIKVGDEVWICAQITNYNGTVETMQNAGYLYSLNGKTSADGQEDGGTATGDGTVDHPYNCVAANNYTSTLAADVNSSDVIYIKGIVSSVKEEYGTQYGNASFYISDDGTSNNQFYVYRALYLNNEKYTEGKTNIKAGDEVVVCGKVVNYMGNTPETVKGEAYLYSLKSSEVTPDTPDTPSADLEGTVFTAKDWNIANGTALETLNLSDGTTLTFDGGGNTNVPKYYDNGTNVRMYPKNSVTVTSSSKKIVKISFACDSYNGETYNSSGELTVEPGLVSKNGDILVVSNVNATSAKITLTPTATSGVASQLRFTKIAIKYAD